MKKRKDSLIDFLIIRDSDIKYVEDDILTINLKMSSFALITAFLAFLSVGIYSLHNNTIHSRTDGYFISALVLFGIFFIQYIPFKSKLVKTVIVSFLTSFSLVALGIWMSYITPDRRSVAFYIIIALSSILFVNKPRYNTLFVLCADIAFMILMRNVKTEAIYEFDVFSVFIYSMIGILLEHVFVKTRVLALTKAKDMLRISHYDVLTEIKNRNSYEQVVKEIKKQEVFTGSVLFFDIDNLHGINNSEGHKEGDRVITMVSKVLKESFNLENIYRTGGDEFIVLVDECNKDFISEKMEKIQQGFKENKCVVSNGYSCSNGDKTFEQTLEEAESLMYNDKSNNYIRKYSDEVLMSKKSAVSNMTFDDISRAYSLLYDSMIDYIYIYDIDSDIIRISDAAVKRFRMDTSKLLFTERLKDLVFPEDLEAITTEMSEIRSGVRKDHNLTYRWMDRKGNPCWIVCQGKVIESDDKKARFLIGSMAEVGNTPLADNLTGFLNLKTQEQVLEKKIKQDKFYALLIGIDNLGSINRHHGYDVGESVIKTIAEIIKDKIKTSVEVVKLYSDQFLIVDDETNSYAEAIELYNEIRKDLEERNLLKNESFLTISAGVINSDYIFESFADCLNKLSFSLKEAKRQGKNRIFVYNQGFFERQFKKEELLVLLKRSIINNFEGFTLLFQPVMHEPSGEISGAEALLRFQANGVDYSPVEFIPILEENDLICEVGEFITDKSIELLKSIKSKFFLSVNFSYKQLLSEDAVERFITKVTREGLQNSFIIELTESGFITRNDFSSSLIKKLVDNGITISIDDFGTGYSNFYNIIKWKPSIIKIDKLFVMNCDKNEKKKSILFKMIELGHHMDAKITCEGVETDAELEIVRNANANFVQGYYYSKPVSSVELLKKYDLTN